MSLSADGNVVAIAAPYDDDAGETSGVVRVFEWVDQAWTQRGGDINGEAKWDHSGESLSLNSDGTIVAIGAWGNDGDSAHSDMGHARVFALVGDEWTQLGADLDGADAQDRFGGSVSLSADGTVLAVGASNNGPWAGHARIFAWSEEGSWVQMGDAIEGEAAHDHSGSSVSLSAAGDVIAIGAPYNDGAGNDAGHVRLFAFIDDAWVQRGDDIDGPKNTNLGSVVSLSADGTVVAAGGYVSRIFSWTNNEWKQLGADFETDFGDRAMSLSADGRVVAFGSPQGGTGYNAGDAAVYAWDGTTWAQVDVVIEGQAPGGRLGHSVSLSADGSTLAVGAPDYDSAAGIKAGQVRVFHACADCTALPSPRPTPAPTTVESTVSWTRRGADLVGGADGFGGFESGHSVSLSAAGDVVAVGAPRATGAAGARAGRTQVFAWSEGAWVQMGSDIEGEAEYDYSGMSIDLSAGGTVVAIGAPSSSSNGYESGRVRIFAYDRNGWTQRGDGIDGEAAGDRAGYSLSLSAEGDVVAIGATHNNADGNDDRLSCCAGHARVFAYADGEWAQRGADIDGKRPYEASGTSVSLSSSGLVVAVGSPMGAFMEPGHVRVFIWADEWVQRGDDIEGEKDQDMAGGTATSLSLSAEGDVIAVGSWGADNAVTGYQAGHVRVFSWLEGSWQQLGSDIDGEVAGDQSGFAVGLAADGKTLIVGAPHNDYNRWGGEGSCSANCNGKTCDHWAPLWCETLESDWGCDCSGCNCDWGSQGASTGHARVFTYDGDDWKQRGADIDGDDGNEQSGEAVAISASGLVVAVGARGHDLGDDGDSNEGRARVLVYPSGDALGDAGAAVGATTTTGAFAGGSGDGPSCASKKGRDSKSWHRKDAPTKTCAWVERKPTKRCRKKGATGARALTECVRACASCPSEGACADDATWSHTNKKNKKLDCVSVARNAGRRCALPGAAAACERTCGEC